ncbi:hypothetical protein Dimus_003615, partial [Dionaea muscipula]
GSPMMMVLRFGLPSSPPPLPTGSRFVKGIYICDAEKAILKFIGQQFGNRTIAVVVYKYLLQGVWDDQRQQVQLHWTILFSQLIAQWAQWL